MTSPSLGSLVQAFFVEHLLKHKGASPRTVAAYRDAFRLLLHFVQQTQGKQPASLTLAALDVPTLLAFLSHLEQHRQNSARSRNARLSALHSFFRFVALREPSCLDLATRVLAIPIKRTTKRLVGFLTRPEIDALLKVCDRSSWMGRRDHALLLFMYNTGARVSEVTELRQHQVHLGESGSVHLQGKGRKERAIPLWARTARILQQWFVEQGHRPDHPVFPNAQGRCLTRHGVAYLLHQVVARAQQTCPSLCHKTISPHVLRHTTAMHLIQAGVDSSVIALWLGHESLQTTHMYVEAELKMKQQALSQLEPAGQAARSFKPQDALLHFLESL